MNFPLYIARRYLRSKSSNNAINIITKIASIGVVVGSLSLFLVLSVFSGLKSFSTNFLNATDPNIRITAAKGKSFLFTTEINEILDRNSAIKFRSKIIEERVFLKYDNKDEIAFIKGVAANYNKVVAIDSVIDVGSWLDTEFSNTAVIGNGISYKLSLGILNFGKPLEIFVPKPGVKFRTANNAFSKVNAQIVGTYSGTEEFVNKYVFALRSISSPQ